MKVLASLWILLALLAVSQATAETRSITIGKFTYVGTGTQTCISIALQLVSLTGKNFSFLLADGEQFCAFGIDNTFVLAKADQSALDPQCNAQGFCKGASAPIVLRAAPARSCN